MARTLKDLIVAVDGLQEYILKESIKRIRRRTPVDEGTARLSWFIGEDGIYSSDNPEKIMALEWGHSDQAPAGMVRITAAEVRDMTEEYMRKKL